MHGSLPTDEKIAELTGHSLVTIKKFWKNETFRTAVMHRGVPLDTGRSEALLTIQQLEIANRLLNVHDNRSVREKLNEVGVSSQQYNAWLRQPAFKAFLAKRGEELFKSADHEAYAALIGVVRGGDVSALKLFFEMRGIYNPKLQVDVNIDMVMTHVIEIIARHVRDPEALQAIANDLESIELGPGRGMPILDVPVARVAHETSDFLI